MVDILELFEKQASTRCPEPKYEEKCRGYFYCGSKEDCEVKKYVIKEVSK